MEHAELGDLSIIAVSAPISFRATAYRRRSSTKLTSSSPFSRRGRYQSRPNPSGCIFIKMFGDPADESDGMGYEAIS